MWSIQILWADVWVTVQRGFASRGDAEWATAKWKQANNCTNDRCFRVYQEPAKNDWENLAEEDRDDLEASEHDQRAEDESIFQNELRRQVANRV